MRTLTDFITKKNSKDEIVESLRMCADGLSIDESIFSNISEEEFTELFFEAFNENTSINESTKNILDYIADAANGKEVDEGVLAGIFGGGIGLALGPKVGQAICNALNIQKGVLYDLLNSRLVTTAICAKLGLRM